MNSSLPSGTKLGRYEIRSKIGEGGMGEVYLAQDIKLDRKVALKILPADVASQRDRMDRFVREAKSAAALNHPNIAHIYEIGEHDGVNFIAMEFIDGQTLREMIHGGQTDLTKLLRHLQHVADGLAKAHAAGIVHRDLKPDNVMITRDGHAKILDFGLVKLIEPQQSSSTGGEASEQATAILQQHSTPGSVLGTVGYMSPEQAQGKTKEIDHRSDIFSFGCILYEAVTGHKAFEGKDPIDSLNKIIREPPAPISDFRPDAPNHLQRILRRCLAKDPDDRYQTIKDVAIELRELRRELAGGAGDDVTATPTRSDAATGAGVKSTSLESAASSSTPSRSSSAEYVVTGIKQHKLAVTVVLLLFVSGAIGMAVFLQARNSGGAIESIAVLPFANQSNDPESDYLSDGITESITDSLTRLPGLKVIPASATLRYKGKSFDPQKAGDELHVNAVLTGRVVQRGDNLTISVELDDIRYGKELWGERYNRKVSDVLTVQNEIANEASQRLRSQLTGEDRQKLAKGSTQNPEAYQLYLKGNYYASKYTRDGLQKGIDYFNQAIALDPNYALAHNGLAYYYLAAVDYTMSPHDSMPKARDAATRALAIDERLPDAHSSLGTIAWWYDWDPIKADQEFKRALELDPNNTRTHQYYGQLLVCSGRLDEGVAEGERARALDPTSAEINMYLGADLVIARRPDQAIDQLRKTLDLDPTYWTAHDWLGRAYEQKGDPKAIEEFERARQLEDSIPENWSNLAHATALNGEHQEALKILDHVKEMSARTYLPPYNVATIYAALGDKDQAFAWLERAFNERSQYLSWMQGDSQLDSLRADPRFADLVKRAGLTQ